jgi:hypothetical protein
MDCVVFDMAAKNGVSKFIATNSKASTAISKHVEMAFKRVWVMVGLEGILTVGHHWALSVLYLYSEPCEHLTMGTTYRSEVTSNLPQITPQ